MAPHASTNALWWLHLGRGGVDGWTWCCAVVCVRAPHQAVGAGEPLNFEPGASGATRRVTSPPLAGKRSPYLVRRNLWEYNNRQ